MLPIFLYLIKNLKIFELFFTGRLRNSDPSSSDPCSICLDVLTLALETNCGHVFCGGCFFAMHEAQPPTGEFAGTIEPKDFLNLKRKPRTKVRARFNDITLSGRIDRTFAKWIRSYQKSLPYCLGIFAQWWFHCVIILPKLSPKITLAHFSSPAPPVLPLLPSTRDCGAALLLPRGGGCGRGGEGRGEGERQEENARIQQKVFW